MYIDPFIDGDTSATFRNILDKIKQEIASLENDYVLKASEDELEEYFIDKVTISPLRLYVNKYYIENQSRAEIDVSNHPGRLTFPGERAAVSGTSLDIAIPYEGDIGLWRLRPSSFGFTGYPQIMINENEIIINISFPDNTADTNRLKQEIERAVESLKQAADNILNDVEQHNTTATQEIKTVIQQRIKRASETSGVVADLGIPIKRRDKPLVFTAPVKRRRSPVQRPSVSTEPYSPEPVLDDAEYQHILKVLKSMSLVIEQNPNTFNSLDEESIRNHFLLQLNGHYEGNATGETFNSSGKTDIIIKVEGKNIFIAECKFWRGTKAFGGAINQLLRYLSWRDTKCALLVFNKTKDSSAIKEKMNDEIMNHPEFKKILLNDKDGDSKYVFTKKTDEGRDIIITSQIYDLPD